MADNWIEVDAANLEVNKRLLDLKIKYFAGKRYLHNGYSYHCWCSQDIDRHSIGPCSDGCGTKVILYCKVTRCPCPIFQPYAHAKEEDRVFISDKDSQRFAQ